MKHNPMLANFNISRSILRQAVVNAGLSLATTHPQAEGFVQVIFHRGTKLGEESHQCTVAAVAAPITMMILIGFLAQDGKDCLISCKSVGY